MEGALNRQITVCHVFLSVVIERKIMLESLVKVMHLFYVSLTLFHVPLHFVFRATFCVADGGI